MNSNVLLILKNALKYKKCFRFILIDLKSILDVT